MNTITAMQPAEAHSDAEKELIEATLERAYEFVVALSDDGIIDFEGVAELRDALAIVREWREAVA